MDVESSFGNEIIIAEKIVKENVSSEFKGKNPGGKKESGWARLGIKKHVALEIIHKESVEDEKPELCEDDAVCEMNLLQYFLATITKLFKINFKLTTEVFNRKLGFGFISEDERKYDYKIVSITSSAFFDQKVVNF